MGGIRALEGAVSLSHGVMLHLRVLCVAFGRLRCVQEGLERKEGLCRQRKLPTSIKDEETHWLKRA
eukprot:1099755-Pelagomonas_calceolata.AAC.1